MSRVAAADDQPEPTLEEALSRLQNLVQGHSPQTRREAADWAAQYLDWPFDEPVLREAIDLLVSVDLITTDRPYLYGPEDFAAWHHELTAKAGL